MNLNTKLQVIVVVLTIIIIILMIFAQSIPRILPEDTGTYYNSLDFISDSKYFFQDQLLVLTSLDHQEAISKIEITKSIPPDEIYYDNTLEFEIQVIPKVNINSAKIVAFLVDPRGIIQYEFPKNSVKNLTDTEMYIKLDKKINFKIELTENPSSIINGEWVFYVLLINNNDAIIGEILKPIYISSNGIDFLPITGVIVIIGIWVGFFLFRKKI
jgi:hypothetical protein